MVRLVLNSFFFFNWGIVVLQCCVSSTVQQSGVDFPVLYSRFLFICFIHISVFFSVQSLLYFKSFLFVQMYVSPILSFFFSSSYGTPIRIRYTSLLYSPYLKPCFIVSISLVSFCIVDCIFRSNFQITNYFFRCL